MPRLNAVLMAILAVAVIGTAVFLSLEPAPSAAGSHPAHVQKLLRKLADSDPDIRREGETGFRALGPRAIAPLAEASRSSDRRVAEIAARLLREVEPVPALEARTPQPAPEAPARVDPVELILVCGRTTVRPEQPVRFYVRIVNHGTAPVLIARQGSSYARFAWIELTDPSGAVAKLPPEPTIGPDEGGLEVLVLAPGAARDLYAGIGDGSTGLSAPAGKGPFQVRFVYDASEESAYRLEVRPSEQGTLLPPQRLASNVLELALAE